MSVDIIIDIPDYVYNILQTLNSNGFKAYVVGGCVRDSILGKMPNDWDIATSAKPVEIKKLFQKTIDTGLKHGTVTVVINQSSYEVTTFRVDGEYEDNRRPCNVEFTSSLENDLSRRDFTINAMAYHPLEGIVDPFNGIRDIRNRDIRSVGNAVKRFQEDALRMLRAVRFAAQLDFVVDESVLLSIKQNGHLINNISQERIRDELTKILLSDNPSKFALLNDTGILKYLLPEFEVCFKTTQNNPYHIYNVAVHILRSVSNIESNVYLRWAMLLHDIGKPVTKTTDEKGIDHFYGHPGKSVILAQKILKRLKFDNKTISKVCKLIKYHDRNIEPSCKSVRKAIAVVGEDIFSELLKVMEADKRAQNPQFLEARLDKFNQIKAIYYEIKQKEHCLSLKDLAVNGHDILDMGFKQGKEINIVLNRLLDMVIEDPALNTRKKLIKIVENIYIYNSKLKEHS